jgi:hypothetical protein
MEANPLKYFSGLCRESAIRIIFAVTVVHALTGCGSNTPAPQKQTPAKAPLNISVLSQAVAATVTEPNTHESIEITDTSLREILSCFEQGRLITADMSRLGYAEYSIKFKMSDGQTVDIFLGGLAWESSNKLAGYLKTGWRERFKSLFTNYSQPSVFFHGTTNNVVGNPFFVFCFTNSLSYSIQCDAEDVNGWGPHSLISELNSNTWNRIRQKQFCCGRFPQKIEPGKSVLFRVYPRTNSVWRAGIEYYVGTNYYTATVKNIIWSLPITGSQTPDKSLGGNSK